MTLHSLPPLPDERCAHCMGDGCLWYPYGNDGLNRLDACACDLVVHALMRCTDCNMFASDAEAAEATGQSLGWDWGVIHTGDGNLAVIIERA